jgi:hypothetical protein
LGKKLARPVSSREIAIYGNLGRKLCTADLKRWKREKMAWEVLQVDAFMGSHLKRSSYLQAHDRMNS